MERMQRLCNANLCDAARSHLGEFICIMFVFRSGFIWSSGGLSKKGAVIFPPPQSGAGFTGGAMNPACCVMGTFWRWIRVAVPEIALWFRALLTRPLSWCCRKRAAVIPVWCCIASCPWLRPCWLSFCISTGAVNASSTCYALPPSTVLLIILAKHLVNLRHRLQIK